MSFPAAPLSLKVGTRWTYQVDGSPQRHHYVESFSTISTSQGSVNVAVVRRDDGNNRLVFTSNGDWYECQASQLPSNAMGCNQPLMFFKTPAEAGQTWKSGDFLFSNSGIEPVTVFGEAYPHAWKIVYAPLGSPDPLGEMWLDETAGRIRIVERGAQYQLASFSSGTGEELKSSPEAAVKALLEESPAETKVEKPLPPPPAWHLDKKWMYVGIFSLAVFLPIIAIGILLLGSLKRRESSEALPSPKTISSELQLITAVARGGDVSQARTRLLELVSSHPNYPDLHHQLALLHQAEGDLESARKSWEAALRIHTGYIEARLDYARLLFAMGEFAEAARHFGRVADKKPGYADVHLALAQALLALGKTGEARRAAEHALELNPKLSEAREVLRQCQTSASPAPAT